MATTQDTVNVSVAQLAVKRMPSGSLRFDWAAATFALLLASGIYLDGWAHVHGMVDNSFFTPWHAVLYASFLFSAAFLTLTLLYNHQSKRYTWTRSLPQGYGWSLLGVAIFALAGILDMVWHILFGIEVNVDALLSPTHLMLAFGAFLMVSGPLRAAWLRYPAGHRYTMAQLLPAVLSATLAFSELVFMAQFSHPEIDPWPAHNYIPAGYPPLDPLYSQALGIVSILLQTALLMGFVLLLSRRWQLPLGSFTLLFTLNAVFVSFLNDYYLLIIPIALAGISADVLCNILQPGIKRPIAFRIFAFAVPLIYYCFYFLTLLLMSGVDWSIHLWMGSIFLAGVVGLLLSYLLLPPLSELHE